MAVATPKAMRSCSGWGFSAKVLPCSTTCADGSTTGAFASSVPDVSLFDSRFHAPRSVRSNINWSGAVLGNRLLAQDEIGGALPTIFAAVADVPGNSFAGPGGFMEQRGPAKLVGRKRTAQDADLARRLWDVSEQLTNVRFPLGAKAAA